MVLNKINSPSSTIPHESIDKIHPEIWLTKGQNSSAPVFILQLWPRFSDALCQTGEHLDNMIKTFIQCFWEYRGRKWRNGVILLSQADQGTRKIVYGSHFCTLSVRMLPLVQECRAGYVSRAGETHKTFVLNVCPAVYTAKNPKWKPVTQYTKLPNIIPKILCVIWAVTSRLRQKI